MQLLGDVAVIYSVDPSILDPTQQFMYGNATKWNNISDIELNFRVCFVDITASIVTE